MSINELQEEVIEEFSAFDDWMEQGTYDVLCLQQKVRTSNMFSDAEIV